jgi:hypothetical protein
LLDWVVPTPHALEIVLTADERAELEGWARWCTSAAGLAMRSRIVLAAADGGSNTELSERLGLSITTVRRWRNRFAELRLDGLVDEPRLGRPRVVGSLNRHAAFLAAFASDVDGRGPVIGGANIANVREAELLGA